MLTYRDMRPQSKRLKYHSQIPFFYRNHVSLSRIDLIVKAYNTACRLYKASNNTKKGSFSTARWTQNSNKFRISDIQINFLEGLGFAEGFCNLLYM